MKKILILTLMGLCCAFAAWGDEPNISDMGYLKVDIKSGTLNLRSKPDEKSKIIAKLPKGSYLNYDGEWKDNWIKVNFSKDKKGPDDIGFIYGWINADFVQAPNFKSQILSPVFQCEKGRELSKDLCDYTGCGLAIYNVEGAIVFRPGLEIKDGFYINLKGTVVKLFFDEGDIGYTLYNDKHDIRIEVYTIPGGDFWKVSSSSGFLKIRYKNQTEILLVKALNGC